MKKTRIQWCHSTVNPVMGCDGCELWPGPGAVAREIGAALGAFTQPPPSGGKASVRDVIGGQPLSAIYANRKNIAQQVTGQPAGKKHAAVVDGRGRAVSCSTIP